MKPGDRIKMFADSDTKAYMRLVANEGFRSRYEDGYVIVGELYYQGKDKRMIAKSLIKARRELNMDRDEFAELIGVTRSTVCNWERAYTAPNYTNRKRLRDLIGWEA